ncbi:MAG TPA: hypothetical protein VFE36_06115, partial [Candidatus Baltobacteraceae bacterium]|nr:hypothetical protein [Candidatus Baltobacteraceae bacterium]
MLKRLGAVLLLAGCSGGAMSGVPSNSPALPAALLRPANANLSYAGTLQQTNTGGIVTTFAVSERVTGASGAGKNDTVAYHGKSVQSGKGSATTTTFDATVAQEASNIRQGKSVTRTKIAVDDSSGVNATTEYGKGNGVFDVVPEVNGASWTNSAARVVSVADSQAGSTLDDQYLVDGSYSERAVPVLGRTASSQSFPDGNASYQWPLGGEYLNSSISYTPPRYGVLHVLFTDALHHLTDFIELHSWYPAHPLALASDTTKNAGSVRIPKSCRVASHFGTTATELDESVTRVDIVFGEYETTTRTAYVGSAGLLCLHVHDELGTHYDYNALAFSQKLLTTSTVDEVLGLREAGGASGAIASSAVAMPLDANLTVARAELRLQDAAAIYTSLRRVHHVKHASATPIASIALAVHVAYPPAGKAITTPVEVTALDANG